MIYLGRHIVIALLCFSAFSSQAFALSKTAGCIELDLAKKEISFNNFDLNGSGLAGNFFLTLDQKAKGLILNLEGKGITINQEQIPWAKLRLVKRKEIIFVENLSFPQVQAKGEIDLAKQELALNVDVDWQGKTETIQGAIKAKIKIWGGFDNLLVSGYLEGKNGSYKGNEFTEIRMDFFGKPPLLNITDSRLLLAGGSVLEIKGTMDLRDFSNLIPEAEYIVRKLFFDDWQMFSEDNSNVALKKHLDKNLEVFLSTNRQENELVEPGAEVRYSLKNNNFLKLEMQDKDTRLKFEKKNEF